MNQDEFFSNSSSILQVIKRGNGKTPIIAGIQRRIESFPKINTMKKAEEITKTTKTIARYFNLL